ncbi:MAG: restriction endonuclease subunit S [Candidatus Marinimicrobia bacterium]|nr:restriction endonuclease subunit S [Candidatus Neomarinimicrobiota bacterium]
MQYKNLIKYLGFLPKENTSGIYQKKYPDCDEYCVEINFEKEVFNYGNKIKAESKTTQNFAQAENWVVLECVDRLLKKGYKPKNITLEKTYPSGHGTSGRLDILVAREDDSAYLMIECKTWGAEFEKELKKTEKDGGQLFTYFQQDKNTDLLMLYASELDGDEIKYRNIIIKIEEDYRQVGNVKDFYERWNKLPKTNGIFESWVAPYEYKNKALTKKDLKVLRQEDSSFIFNRFLEILRHNVVSDKPNAFNKIFTLFLCKIVDENRNDEEELHFQWLEGKDDHISFQKRMTDLYNKGMLELLEKKVTDVSDSEFDKRFKQVEERYKEEFKAILTEIRLKKNNEFAIKEVYDDASFQENAKVVKEIVELLQDYKIRYNYRQQFLSDFFELLLTTGLKQESGQFFTPVPIARFIIKSIPLREIAELKIQQGNKNDLLPLIIDYAAGSGHFITESMEEVQKYIDSIDENKYSPTTKKAIKGWQDVQFDWAEKYIYAIEKDYRLVKTAKVSCYLHGDGLAKVVHGDGLGDFSTSTEFKDLLKETDRTYPQDNKQFDIIISNPPYSVSAFKGTIMEKERATNAFELYPRLTDQSSEIECLFVERTKQLLKDGGVAGIILPSSILSNTGIYTQTREIILKYFEIVAIAKLGSSTFMATGTNTVTLFLRRRNNADAINIKAVADKFFVNLQDVTINGIENPVRKYLAHVWVGLAFDDYASLIKKQPNAAIQQHEIYREYQKKIKGKNEKDKWDAILELEQEKLFYFILASPQKLVLINTGKKIEEKQFLGYEFSYRRGSEGIHPIQRRKTIDDCTQLYDANSFTNPQKASTYIYKAFNGDFDAEIPESLQKNISHLNLVDMLTFDRVDFEKNISLSTKKKVKIKSKFEEYRLSEILVELQSGNRPKGGVGEYKSGIPSLGGEHIGLDGNILSSNIKFIPEVYFKNSKQGVLKDLDILICKDGALTGKVALFKKEIFPYDLGMINEHVFILRTQYELTQKYLFSFLFSINGQYLLKANITGQAQGGLNRENLLNIQIPLPPKDIQENIVTEIEVLEGIEKRAKEEIDKLNNDLTFQFNKINLYDKVPLESISENLDKLRKPVTKGYREHGEIPYYGASGIVDYVSDYLLDDYVLLISEDGANLKERTTPIAFTAQGKIWVNNHAHILRFSNKETHKLVELYLNKTDISEYITGQAQPKLNQQNLNIIKIPLPSLPDQKQIVSEIERIEVPINKLKNKIEAIPQQKEAILKKYLE